MPYDRDLVPFRGDRPGCVFVLGAALVVLSPAGLLFGLLMLIG